MRRPPILATADHGLVTRRQLTDAGFDLRDGRRLLRDGVVVRLRHGVYVDGEVWAGLDEWRGRPLHRMRASAMALQRQDFAFSHDSAALAWNLPVPDGRTAL